MFTKPEYGWTDVTIGDYTSRASYITDIPFDALDNVTEAIKYKDYGQTYTQRFDAEGWEFIIEADANQTKLTIEEEDTKTIIIPKTMFDWAKEIITDIETYLEDWAKWTWDQNLDEPEQYEENKKELQQKINQLKALLEETEETT